MASTDVWIYVVTPDACGRLIGKRLAKTRYAEAAGAGMPMPGLHLATGLANVTRDNIAVFGAHNGFRNGLLRLDPETGFRVPGSLGAQWYLSDVLDAKGASVAEAPRTILQRQLQRLDTLGLGAVMSSELEFYLFDQTYSALAAGSYREMQPFYWRHGDNDPLVALVEHEFLGDLQEDLHSAGIVVDQVQPEGGRGQMEVNVAPQKPMKAADQHAIFKHVVKARCMLAGKAATFLSKPLADDAGSGGHIHLCLTDQKGQALLDESAQPKGIAASFIAGILRYASDFMVLFAPYHNSYRRFCPGSFAPVNADWGWHGRDKMVRLTGSGNSARLEFRLPGSDVNPHLSYSGLIAAGIAGVEEDLELDLEGDQPERLMPPNLPLATVEFTRSDCARVAFGEQVHGHLLSHVMAELKEEQACVPDTDLFRGFEAV